MEIILMIGCIILLAGLVFLLIQFLKAKNSLKSIIEKYKDVIDVDEYKLKVTKETEQLVLDRQTNIDGLDKQILGLKTDYSAKYSIFENLLREISLYEEEQEIISYGLYQPHFDFDTSEKYKNELLNVREKEKALIRAGQAAPCNTKWTVNNSVSEGTKLTKHYAKLMLRAFNGECEALNADVRWNNANKMEERMRTSFLAINKLGETHNIRITDQYYDLKLKELELTYEYQEKIHQEKEEQRRIQEQIREEERAQKELDKAIKDAQDDEERYSKALEQARKEIEAAQGDTLTKLQEKMAKLEAELEEAKKQKERALSMAQQTKAGFIYVISNIGSFGEDIYKIGMTRRLEPMDRVKELGDSSVPFEFDVHAMIYSDNAPELELALHKEFDQKRLNLVNTRKEFFHVPLSEIEQLVKSRHSSIEFTLIAEARAYRESLAIRDKNSGSKEASTPPSIERFPSSI
jgi:hypothetical protein